MAINLDDIATKVMKLMQGNGHQMKMFDATSGKSVAIPAEARYFYVKEPNMMVNIDDSTQELKFHIGEDVDIDKPGINNMMKQLKSLARTNMLDFDIRSFGKHIKPKNYAYKVEQNKEQTMTDHVNEGMGPLSGSSRTSRQTLENVRLILKHRAPVNEESRGSRSRNISAMFIETAEGERFKYPFIHLNGARAMARHVASGGVPHDIVGEAIVELSSNLAQLKEFTKIVDKQQLVNENNRNVVFNVRCSMNSIKETVQRIQGARGYAKFVENIALKEDKVEAEISEETLDSYVQQFTKTSFEESLKDILPLVHRVNEEEMTDRRDNQTARVREIISARDKKTGEIVNTISFGEPTNPSYDYDKIKTQFAEPRSSEEVAQQKISKIALTFDDLADRVTVDTLLDRTTKKKGHDLAAEISFFLTDIANEIRSNPSGIDKEDMKVAGHLLKMSKASVETEEPKTADTRINEMLEEAFSKFDSDKVLIKEQKQELKEGTSGIMGMKNSQGNYDFIRVNWDAYPEGLGQTLKNSWNNPEEIERAISKGDASSIGNDIDDSVFYADKEGMNNNKPERNETEEDLHSIAMRMGAEYGYIFDNGKWTEVLHSEEAVSEDIYMENEYETIEWKNRFNKPYYIDEPCPDCGNEVQILSDASSDCPDCGHPEVLPCSECPRLEEQICDWNKWTRCSEFPKTDDDHNRLKEEKSVTDGTRKALTTLIMSGFDEMGNGDPMEFPSSPFDAEMFLDDAKYAIDTIFTNHGTEVPEEISKIYNKLVAYSKDKELQAKNRKDTDVGNAVNHVPFHPENQDELYLSTFADPFMNAFTAVANKLGIVHPEIQKIEKKRKRLRKLAGVTEKKNEINEDDAELNIAKKKPTLDDLIQMSNEADYEMGDVVVFGMKNHPAYRFDLQSELKDYMERVRVGSTHSGTDHSGYLNMKVSEIADNIAGAAIVAVEDGGKVKSLVGWSSEDEINPPKTDDEQSGEDEDGAFASGPDDDQVRMRHLAGVDDF